MKLTIGRLFLYAGFSFKKTDILYHPTGHGPQDWNRRTWWKPIAFNPVRLSLRESNSSGSGLWVYTRWGTADFQYSITKLEWRVK